MNQNIKTRYMLEGESVVEALKKKNYDAYFVESKEKALEKVISLIPEGATVSWGGSASIDEIGIKEVLANGEYQPIDRDSAGSPEERMELMRKGLLADVFLMSSNAISADGYLVNIDGLGNRVAALNFGPKEVIIVAGMNKVVKSLDDALSRAQNIAAPINAQRFDIETPCKKTGICYNCQSPQGICSKLVITRFCNPPKRIKVVLVGEDMGF